MTARSSLWRITLPAALLGGAAMLVVALGAGFLNHQLRENERQRAVGEARQLAFGVSRDAAEHFWRFREEFIFSLTHLPYERLLTERESAPETLVSVRRFLALNQNILRELIVVGPGGEGRSMRMRGENYVVFSPLGPKSLPEPSSGPSNDPAVAITGVVQASDGTIRAQAAAVLSPLGFWQDTLTAFSLSHPGFWIHLLDSQGRPMFGRHGGEYYGEPPSFDEAVSARLAEDGREGYEGRLLHSVRIGGVRRDFISAYVPVRMEGWSGMLMISLDEGVVLGPAAKALGILAAIAVVVFLLLLAIFVHFTRYTLRNQRQLEQSRRLAETSAREAEAANRAKSSFLAMMSHELRTPLNSILGLSESLVERLHGPLTDKQARYLELVLTSGRHLLSLINDILDLAKIESGRLETKMASCSLRMLCEGALQVVQPMAARRRQRLVTELPAQDPSFLGDARLLHQLLVNLLGNAVKFTPDGGALGLRVAVSPGQLKIQIWDQGIGIAAEDISRLFQPFVQLDTRLARDYGGTGLGLALVRQIAQLHGGTVEVESRLGEGSTFTFVLPLHGVAAHQGSAAVPAASAKAETTEVPVAVAPAPAATSSSAPPPTPVVAPVTPVASAAPAAPEGPLVLIVDDTAFNVVPLRDYLEQKGCRVAVAENGRLAIEQTVKLRPDLILMDIQMPEMDGIEATRHIRALPDPVLARVPIFAVTALAMPSDRERCLAAGLDDYISKPYSPRELHARIRARIAGEQTARAQS